MQSEKVSSIPRDFDIDDYIGMESCVDLEDHHTAAEMSPPTNFPERGGNSSKRRKYQKQKNYPPPIPLLVRTENLASHMPWVMKRHYTSDGRLILTEERVKHHEYFRAHRSEGRLMLQLVAVDNEVSDESNEEMGNEEGGGEECTAAEGGENEGGRMVVGEGGKWYNKYGNVSGRDPAFMFGVTVPAGSLRTVRS